MLFKSLNLTTWLSGTTLTRPLMDALGEASSTSTSYITLIDLRPVAAQTISSHRRRSMLQYPSGSRQSLSSRTLLQLPSPSSGTVAATGVQVTLLVITRDPDVVGFTIKAAVMDGSFAGTLATHGLPRDCEVSLKSIYPPSHMVPPGFDAAHIAMAALIPLAAAAVAAAAAGASDRCRRASRDKRQSDLLSDIGRSSVNTPRRSSGARPQGGVRAAIQPAPAVAPPVTLAPQPSLLHHGSGPPLMGWERAGSLQRVPPELWQQHSLPVELS